MSMVGRRQVKGNHVEDQAVDIILHFCTYDYVPFRLTRLGFIGLTCLMQCKQNDSLDDRIC